MKSGWRTFTIYVLLMMWTASIYFLAILPGENFRPLLHGSPNGDGTFIFDEFYVYKPNQNLTFLPDWALENFIVKQNLIHEPNDRFVTKKGSFKSLPFTPSRWMAVPVLGADTNQLNLFERRAHVVVECIESGARIQLLDAPSESWFLSVVRVPEGWCPAEAQIVADSSEDTLSVGFGTPMEVTALFFLSHGPLGTVVAAVVAIVGFLLIAIPFIICPGINIMTRLAAAALYPSIAGYVIFLTTWFYHSPKVTSLLSVLYFMIPATTIAIYFYRTKVRHDQRTGILFGSACCALLVILVAPWLLLNIGGGIWFPGYAFFPASWSTDNLLSIMAAKSVLILGPGHPEFLGNWSLSDRGVVQAGQLMPLMALPLVGKSIYGTQIGYQVVQIFGGLLQGLIIPCLIVFLHRVVRISLSPILSILFITSTPFIMFNSFYIWPKLSGGTLFLTALYFFWDYLAKGKIYSIYLTILSLTLSILSHSANMLGVFVFPIYLGISLFLGHHKLADLKERVRSSIGPVILTTTVSAMMLHIVASMDPKSSWPLLYLITGEGRFGLNHEQTTSLIKQFFVRLSFLDFVGIKLSGLLDLIWMRDHFFSRSHSGYSLLAPLRAQQMFSLTHSFGPGIFALILIGIISRRRTIANLSHADEGLGGARLSLQIMAVACFCNLILFVLAFQIPMVVHHLPYGLILGILLGIFSFFRDAKSGLMIGSIIQVLNIVVVWYYGTLVMWRDELLRLF